MGAFILYVFYTVEPKGSLWGWKDSYLGQFTIISFIVDDFFVGDFINFALRAFHLCTQWKSVIHALTVLMLSDFLKFELWSERKWSQLSLD